MAITSITLSELEVFLRHELPKLGWDHFAIAHEQDLPQPYRIEFRGNRCPVVVIRGNTSPPSNYVMGTP